MWLSPPDRLALQQREMQGEAFPRIQERQVIQLPVSSADR